MIRILIAAAVAMTVSLIGTRLLIHYLTRFRIGQPIRDDGPTGHNTKAGTPTMGGLMIVTGAVFGYTISDFYNGIYTRSGIFVMLAIIGGGTVGLLADERYGRGAGKQVLHLEAQLVDGEADQGVLVHLVLAACLAQCLPEFGHGRNVQTSILGQDRSVAGRELLSDLLDDR